MVFLRPTVIRDRAGIAALSGKKYSDIRVIETNAGRPSILPATPERLFDGQGIPAPAIDLRSNNAPQSHAAPVPEAAPQAAPVQLRSGWAIQVASLSNPESAQALRDQLTSKGFDAYVRVSRGLNRVFVGPVADRQEANRLRDQLSQQQRLDGFVVQYQPGNGG